MAVGVKVVNRPGSLAQQAYLPAIAEGLGVTFRHFVKNFFGNANLVVNGAQAKTDIATIEYPEEKKPYPERHRGLHRLMLRDDGQVRCVACMMCPTVCPAHCITIVPEEAPDGRIEKRPEISRLTSSAAWSVVSAPRPAPATPSAWTRSTTPSRPTAARDAHPRQRRADVPRDGLDGGAGRGGRLLAREGRRQAADAGLGRRGPRRRAPGPDHLVPDGPSPPRRGIYRRAGVQKIGWRRATGLLTVGADSPDGGRRVAGDGHGVQRPGGKTATGGTGGAVAAGGRPIGTGGAARAPEVARAAAPPARRRAPEAARAAVPPARAARRAAVRRAGWSIRCRAADFSWEPTSGTSTGRGLPRLLPERRRLSRPPRTPGCPSSSPISRLTTCSGSWTGT